MKRFSIEWDKEQVFMWAFLAFFLVDLIVCINLVKGEKER